MMRGNPAQPVKSVLAAAMLTAAALMPAGAAPAGAHMSLQACASIAADPQRLACYDRMAQEQKQEQQDLAWTTVRAEGQAVGGPAGSDAPDARHDVPTDDAAAAVDITARDGSQAHVSQLDRQWELTDRTRRPAFTLRLHQDNYLLPAQYTTSRNVAPFARLLNAAGNSRNFDRTELTFQLSLKTRVAERVLGSRADLWLAYTQQSWWQSYNGPLSSPFRETDYQPEAILVAPVRYALLGLRGRFVGLGLVHQSNGQGGTLSRSWNRVTLQTGLERGDFTLLVRPWWRIPERRSDDNNPDITNYLGHGDVQANWRIGGHRLWALLRHDFRTDHGALQLNWAFPLAGALKGYVQLFSGYGASLIDYNFRQTMVGVGVLIDSWQ